MDLPHSPRLLAQLAHGPKPATSGIVQPASAGACCTQGIDVSSYQHPNGAGINWGQVAGAGYAFAAVKSSEGTYYTNPYFSADYAAAKQAGLFAAAYHFATPDTTNGTTQADYTVDHAQYTADGRTLPIELDIEYNPYGAECYGLSAGAMVDWVAAYSAEVQTRTGRLPMIYSTADWWNTCTGGSTEFGASPLWVAAYGTSSPPVPAGWLDWTFWQYTSSGSVPGVANATDLSYFDGDLNGLASFAGSSGAPSSHGSAPVASSPQYSVPGQTDVFRVSGNGTLEVYWVQGGGTWNGPLALSPAGFAPPGAQVVAANQFGIPDQTDVFVVANSGAVNVVWVHGGGNWNGPMAISPTGFAPAGAALAASNQFGTANQTDVFVVTGSGTVNVVWVQGGSTWFGPQAISPGGFAPAGAGLTTSAQFGIPDQTDVFVANNSGAVNVLWVHGSGTWNGPMAISPGGFAPAGAALATSNQFGIANQTDVYAVSNSGTVNVLWVQGAGNWNGPLAISAGGLAPAGAGLAASFQFGTVNQTDVFVTNNQGAVNVVWVQGNGNWAGPQGISPGGLLPAGAGLSTSNQFGIPDQTDVFGVASNGAVNTVWVHGGGTWNGPLVI